MPRKCGIATFTTDLTDAVAAEFPAVDCSVIAMNDLDRRYAYPARVRFEISEGELSSYRRAADFLNVNSIDAVCVQHEYGIFGGQSGSHVLELLRELRMPFVTTLHTIVREPSSTQRRAMDECFFGHARRLRAPRRRPRWPARIAWWTHDQPLLYRERRKEHDRSPVA